MLIKAISSTGIIIVISVIFFALGFAAERLWPAGRQPSWREMRLNLSAGALFTFIGEISGPLMFFWSASVVTALGGGLINIQNLGLGAAAVIILIQLFNYGLHRALHYWGWPLHSFHHSDPTLSAASFGRVHFLQDMVSRVALGIPTAALVAVSPDALTISAVVTAAVSVFIHMNVRWHFGRWAWIIAGPQFHRIHHSTDPKHGDRNYATILPIFDVIFGTYYAPERDEYPETGLYSGHSPASLGEAILWPVIDRAR